VKIFVSYPLVMTSHTFIGKTHNK